jgi:hypothetical protein
MTTATFKAYQGSDRDLILGRMLEIDGWSHIGQVRASSEINHIEVDCHFRKAGKRLETAIRRASLFGAWKIQSITQ